VISALYYRHSFADLSSLGISSLPIVDVSCMVLFRCYGFSSSCHSFSSRVRMVKFRHAWFLRATASWWARGFCFVLHLVSTLLVLFSSMVGFFGAGGVLHLFVFWLLETSCQCMQVLGVHGAVLGVHVFLRAAPCGWGRHYVFVVYNSYGSP